MTSWSNNSATWHVLAVSEVGYSTDSGTMIQTAIRMVHGLCNQGPVGVVALEEDPVAHGRLRFADQVVQGDGRVPAYSSAFGVRESK